MRAMVLEEPQHALQLRDVPKPKPAKGQLLVRIATCAVCRTDLHVVDGELPDPKLPLIPGHQIVGHIEEIADGVKGFSVGDRVGIPWLGWTDGECAYCRSNRENLCDRARFTGYTIDGGYAEFTVADARFCFHLPDRYDDVEVAPLLCAGLIGYRSYRKTEEARRLAPVFIKPHEIHALPRSGNFRVHSTGRRDITASSEKVGREVGRWVR